MEGRIYIFPENKLELQEVSRLIKKELKACRSAIDKQKTIDSVYKRLHNQLNKTYDSEFYEIKYSVDRSGFTKLNVEHNDNAKAHPNYNYILSRQAFYFLKYAIHKHQHHSDKDDSLTTIQPYKSNDENHETGRLLIDDLKESLAQFKRGLSKNTKNHIDARGIASYGLSLIESCKSKEYNSFNLSCYSALPSLPLIRLFIKSRSLATKPQQRTGFPFPSDYSRFLLAAIG